MWKIALAVWGSSAAAIVIALYYTHDIRCLWFLLIPACMSWNYEAWQKVGARNECKTDKEVSEKANSQTPIR